MPGPRRQRLSPEESRARAVEAARALLLEHGPQGVTLKAVAARIGQTHANLLHHFGSAAGLQAAVMEEMGRHLVGKIGDAVLRRRQGKIGFESLVNTVFDTFNCDGAGRLASWMILTGEWQALDPVFRAIHDFVDELVVASDAEKVREISHVITLMALGDALLGVPLADALGLDPKAARQLALQQLVALSGLEDQTTMAASA